MNRKSDDHDSLNERHRQPGGQMKSTLKSEVKKTNVEADSKKLAI